MNKLILAVTALAVAVVAALARFGANGRAKPVSRTDPATESNRQNWMAGGGG
jgi:hypothetical protein